MSVIRPDSNLLHNSSIAEASYFDKYLRIGYLSDLCNFASIQRAMQTPAMAQDQILIQLYNGPALRLSVERVRADKSIPN